MTATFLALLSAYYVCDAAAALQPLSPGTAQLCAAHYEAVKAAFQPDTDRSPEARRLAYLRFKAWESENAEIVARLRARAARNAQSDMTGSPI